MNQTVSINGNFMKKPKRIKTGVIISTFRMLKPPKVVAHLES